MPHLISIIIPIFNGSTWIPRCFEGILKQTVIKEKTLPVEICICNDHSNDDTAQLLEEWRGIFENHGVTFKIHTNLNDAQGGVGYSKNRAVDISSGDFLCFQDIDDLMLPDRLAEQYEKALHSTFDTIIGCRFQREPHNSTARYTRWANSLTDKHLNIQVYTSHGPTVIMPTWFCHRNVYKRVGGFEETKQGCPEDLIFFYKHLDLGGKVACVDHVLLIYTFHPNQATFSINQKTIWDLRLRRLEKIVLTRWPSFTIWNAGKQGRRLYNSLTEENKVKVVGFCDVDLSKIGAKYKYFDEKTRTFGREIEILHFKEASPPFVICVKIDLTEGVFEENLKSLKLEEDVDYVLFS